MLDARGATFSGQLFEELGEPPPAQKQFRSSDINGTGYEELPGKRGCGMHVPPGDTLATENFQTFKIPNL
jgi:hypothetical protein